VVSLAAQRAGPGNLFSWQVRIAYFNDDLRLKGSRQTLPLMKAERLCCRSADSSQVISSNSHTFEFECKVQNCWELWRDLFAALENITEILGALDLNETFHLLCHPTKDFCCG
jgi:hypothetical protein